MHLTLNEHDDDDDDLYYGVQFFKHLFVCPSSYLSMFGPNP